MSAHDERERSKVEPDAHENEITDKPTEDLHLRDGRRYEGDYQAGMSSIRVSLTPCRYFLVGKCNKGSSCKFRHFKKDTSRIVCPYYQEFGYCKFGSNCMYIDLHPLHSAHLDTMPRTGRTQGPRNTTHTFAGVGDGHNRNHQEEQDTIEHQAHSSAAELTNNESDSTEKANTNVDKGLDQHLVDSRVTSNDDLDSSTPTPQSREFIATSQGLLDPFDTAEDLYSSPISTANAHRSDQLSAGATGHQDNREAAGLGNSGLVASAADSPLSPKNPNLHPSTKKRMGRGNWQAKRPDNRLGEINPRYGVSRRLNNALKKIAERHGLPIDILAESRPIIIEAQPDNVTVPAKAENSSGQHHEHDQTTVPNTATTTESSDQHTSNYPIFRPLDEHYSSQVGERNNAPPTRIVNDWNIPHHVHDFYEALHHQGLWEQRERLHRQQHGELMAMQEMVWQADRRVNEADASAKDADTKAYEADTRATKAYTGEYEADTRANEAEARVNEAYKRAIEAEAREDRNVEISLGSIHELRMGLMDLRNLARRHGASEEEIFANGGVEDMRDPPVTVAEHDHQQEIPRVQAAPNMVPQPDLSRNSGSAFNGFFEQHEEELKRKREAERDGVEPSMPSDTKKKARRGPRN